MIGRNARVRNLDLVLAGEQTNHLTGPLFSEKPAQQSLQIRQRSLAFEHHRPFVHSRVLKDVHKYLALVFLQNILVRVERHHNVGQQIEQQTPEKTMRHRTESFQTQKRIGPKPGLSEKSVLHPFFAPVVMRHNRRQHEGVNPEGESGQNTTQCTGPGSFFPEDSSQQGRSKLSNGNERNQPDGNQGVHLVEVEVIQIGESQNRDNCQPTAPKSDGGNMGRNPVLNRFHTNQNRKQQVVGEHGT